MQPADTPCSARCHLCPTPPPAGAATAPLPAVPPAPRPPAQLQTAGPGQAQCACCAATGRIPPPSCMRHRTWNSPALCPVSTRPLTASAVLLACCYSDAPHQQSTCCSYCFLGFLGELPTNPGLMRLFTVTPCTEQAGANLLAQPYGAVESALARTCHAWRVGGAHPAQWRHFIVRIAEAVSPG